jgi:ribosomal-protein-alanine N-acetyltransferase
VSESAIIYRAMKPEDLDEVMIIERCSFQSPWSRESFLNDIKRDNAITSVAVVGNRVAAYLVAWCVEDEVHIGNLAVHPDYQRQGLGTALITGVATLYPTVRVVWLEVRVSNKAAQNLYRKLGFRQISIRKNYYQIEKEDAIIMVKYLD